MNIANSDDLDNVKVERLLDLFLHNGILDAREGISYMRQASADRLHYLMLTDSNCYSAYQFYNWLYNTPGGKATIALMWADGLIFNKELSTWVNTLTYTGTQNLPGISKYKDMLYSFMDDSSFDIELMEYISNVKELASKTTGSGKLYADRLIERLNGCKDMDAVMALLEKIWTRKSCILKLGWMRAPEQACLSNWTKIPDLDSSLRRWVMPEKYYPFQTLP